MSRHTEQGGISHPQFAEALCTSNNNTTFAFERNIFLQLSERHSCGELFSSDEPWMKEFSIDDPTLPLTDSCFHFQNSVVVGLFSLIGKKYLFNSFFDLHYWATAILWLLLAFGLAEEGTKVMERFYLISLPCNVHVLIAQCFSYTKLCSLKTNTLWLKSFNTTQATSMTPIKVNSRSHQIHNHVHNFS